MTSRELDSTALAVRSTSLSLEEASVEDASGRALSWADAQLAAWSILACLSLVLNAQRPDVAGEGLKTRVLQSLYPAGQLLGAGVLIGAATWAFRARGSRSNVWAAVGTTMAGFTLGWSILKDDFAQLMNRLAHLAPPLVWRLGITLAFAATIPAALFAGRFLVTIASKKGLGARAVAATRAVAVVIGLVAHVIGRNYLWQQAFPGAHLMFAIAAATFIAGALGGAQLPAFLASRGLGSAETGEDDEPAIGRYARIRKLAWVLAAIWGACALLIPPPAQVLFQMLQPPAASMAPLIAELHAPPVPPYRTPSEVNESWRSLPPTPPSKTSLSPADGVVVLVTIDCFRADLLADDRHAETLPNLFALRRGGAAFQTARSAGSFTVAALSALFTGRYQAQLGWAERSTPRSRFRMPAEDPSPRIPEVLGEAGIRSATVTGAEWLDGGSGILRGFTEERDVEAPQRFALGEDLISASIEILDRHGDGPLFFYVHLFDAHDPYDRAGTYGTEYERYVREMQIVDREVGRLVRALDAKLPGRATIIVTADHGEEFGEHGTARHGATVYDEVVRVPLVVRGPRIAPRAIPDAVSTIDLGPTILDLFHVPVPASFMGRSLAPLLAGEKLPPQRVLMESRGVVGLVANNLKIVRRKRFDIVELYDLAADPAEKVNLFREDDARSAERLGALNEAFDDLERK